MTSVFPGLFLEVMHCLFNAGFKHDEDGFNRAVTGGFGKLGEGTLEKREVRMLGRFLLVVFIYFFVLFLIFA